MRLVSGFVPGFVSRQVALLLRRLTAVLEAAAPSVDGPPTPDVLAARLRDQLGREPTREELLRLLALLDGVQSALSLGDGEIARARELLASYADGLRRDAARA